MRAEIAALVQPVVVVSILTFGALPALGCVFGVNRWWFLSVMVTTDLRIRTGNEKSTLQNPPISPEPRVRPRPTAVGRNVERFASRR